MSKEKVKFLGKDVAILDLSLAQAIYLAKQEFPKIYKETDGYNYTYANLGTMMEKIQPILDKYYIDLRHEPVGKLGTEKSFVGVKTILTSMVTGMEMSVEFSHLTNSDDPQSMGSYQTYYRRYNLLCLFNLIPEKKLDDDGESVTKQRGGSNNNSRRL
mgnify:CR=1 FL=1|tara:strand:+ start:952 stop:1425 length:474 start_codon:yes stop_codon:yes gene_type:complete